RAEFNNIAVGDIVRGSINEKKSIIPYNFKVLYVKPEETFVLDKRGTFLVKSVNEQQTRLIIRTQEVEGFGQWLTLPLHYIMERRTLIGVKARVEAGENIQLSENDDIFWFSGIVLSGFMICILVFTGQGIIQSIIVPAIFSSYWLLSLFLFNPIPVYTIGLLLVMFGYIQLIHRIKRKL